MRSSPVHSGLRRRTNVVRLAAAWRVSWRSAPGHVVLLVALAGVTGLVPAAVTWLTKSMIDGLIAGASIADLIPVAIGLLATGLALATLSHLAQYVSGDVDRRCASVLTDQLHGTVSSFRGLSRFEDPRILDQIQMAEQAINGGVAAATTGTISLGKEALTLLSLLATLWLLAPAIAAVVVASAIPSLIAQISLSRHQVRTYAQLAPASRRQFFYSEMIKNPEAAMEVRLFQLGDFLKGRMLAELMAVHRGQREVERRQLTVQALLGLLSAAVSGGGLLWAILAASDHKLSVGAVSAFVAAAAAAQAALTGLVMQVALAHRALLTLDHYLEVIELPDDLPAGSTPRAGLPALCRGIELHDVWFRYDADHPWVLRGVSLRIPYGESVAFVGLNGAGKSTLVKLLCRFYDPSAGHISWDGVDLRDVPITELRQRMSVVFQDFMRYDMTAAENIGVGHLSHLGDVEQIRAAAVTAGIDEKLASLPAGYDTMLTRTFFSAQEAAQQGVLLSGGQWQRLALARALMRASADLLILDEPSAGLDAQAESQVHQQLRMLRAGRTSVLISHRLSTVRQADRIVVLADGKLQEQGSHAALMQLDGRYAHLFSLQAQGYDTGHQPPGDPLQAVDGDRAGGSSASVLAGSLGHRS